MSDDDPSWVNWSLLHELRELPHPNVRDVKLPPEADPFHGIAEKLTEVKVIHHLLDLGGIARGSATSVHASDADARAFLLLRLSQRQREARCLRHGGIVLRGVRVRVAV